jgi:hypothetical protein
MLKLIRQELARDANGIQRKIQKEKYLYLLLTDIRTVGRPHRSI